VYLLLVSLIPGRADDQNRFRLTAAVTTNEASQNGRTLLQTLREILLGVIEIYK
jgi:hypothetical protein